LHGEAQNFHNKNEKHVDNELTQKTDEKPEPEVK